MYSRIDVVGSTDYVMAWSYLDWTSAGIFEISDGTFSTTHNKTSERRKLLLYHFRFAGLFLHSINIGGTCRLRVRHPGWQPIQSRFPTTHRYTECRARNRATHIKYSCIEINLLPHLFITVDAWCPPTIPATATEPYVCDIYMTMQTVNGERYCSLVNSNTATHQHIHLLTNTLAANAIATPHHRGTRFVGRVRAIIYDARGNNK